MLLELKPTPSELLEGWEAEFVERTALGDRIVSEAPTGHVERFFAMDMEVTENDDASDDDSPMRASRHSTTATARG